VQVNQIGFATETDGILPEYFKNHQTSHFFTDHANDDDDDDDNSYNTITSLSSDDSDVIEVSSHNVFDSILILSL
jgi:hypothetical protein